MRQILHRTDSAQTPSTGETPGTCLAEGARPRAQQVSAGGETFGRVPTCFGGATSLLPRTAALRTLNGDDARATTPASRVPVRAYILRGGHISFVGNFVGNFVGSTINRPLCGPQKLLNIAVIRPKSSLPGDRS